MTDAEDFEDPCGDEGLAVTDEEAVSDDDIDGFLLFADIDPSDEEAIAARKAEWEALDGV